MQILSSWLVLFILSLSTLYGQTAKEFVPWQQGYFDIHHINTARGNATFFIFPDGTTLLFDAGAKQFPEEKLHEYFPIPPHDSLSAGGWIAHYIKQVIPGGQTQQIDYAVISHFHNDHYGEITSSSPKSNQFNYFLSGITEVGELLPIKTLIDRGYPDYKYPIDLKKHYNKDKTFTNYQNFIGAQRTQGLQAESLIAGSNQQIVLKHQPQKYKNFTVRNIKSNNTMWSGKGNGTTSIPTSATEEGVDENALSLVLKFSYGKFDYYTGGDLNGFTQWGGVDMESKIASAVGKVEAMALNHHGYYDATNALFLSTLMPSVVVHQVIHDPHYQMDVLQRLSVYPLHLFTYNMHDSVKNNFPSNIAQMYKSTRGHIVIRVSPNGDRYDVYTFDDSSLNLPIINRFGPYHSD